MEKKGRDKDKHTKLPQSKKAPTAFRALPRTAVDYLGRLCLAFPVILLHTSCTDHGPRSCIFLHPCLKSRNGQGSDKTRQTYFVLWLQHFDTGSLMRWSTARLYPSKCLSRRSRLSSERHPCPFGQIATPFPSHAGHPSQQLLLMLLALVSFTHLHRSLVQQADQHTAQGTRKGYPIAEPAHFSSPPFLFWRLSPLSPSLLVVQSDSILPSSVHCLSWLGSCQGQRQNSKKLESTVVEGRTAPCPLCPPLPNSTRPYRVLPASSLPYLTLKW
jgi:hypothetical protein